MSKESLNARRDAAAVLVMFASLAASSAASAAVNEPTRLQLVQLQRVQSRRGQDPRIAQQRIQAQRIQAQRAQAQRVPTPLSQAPHDQSQLLQTPEAISSRPIATFDDASAVPLDLEPGVIETVRERYTNGKVKVQREVTLDSQGNYVNHGPWKMWDPAGQLIAEGQYQMGKRVGAWTRWHPRGDSNSLNEFPMNRFKAPFASQVNFTDGVMDGDWVIIDGDQNRCHLVSMENGRRNGPVITWLPDGKIYKQWTFENGVPVGDVLQVNEAGELQRSHVYQDGRRVVTKTNHYDGAKRQKKVEEMYLAVRTVQDQPDDFWSLRFASYKSEGKDLRHGASKSWYQNGAPQHEGTYEQGKKVNRFTHWYPNGQLALAAQYREDKPHGAWVWWHKNGQKNVYGVYADGTPSGEWRWWSADGQLSKNKTFDGTESRDEIETAVKKPLLLPEPTVGAGNRLDFLR